MTPTLVVCAHGTDDPAGRATVVAIAAAVTRRLPGVDVEVAYVDVQEPRLADVVDRIVGSGGLVVVVPILLSLGFHTEVDVREAVASHPARAVSTGPLGPDPRLVTALVDRLRDAGVPDGTPVVVGVAGSSRPESAAVGRGVARAVGDRWAGPVTVGFLAAARPSVREAVDAARDLAPVAVASYLIGRGFFQDRLEGSGGGWVTEPLGAHPALVEVIAERYLVGSVTLIRH